MITTKNYEEYIVRHIDGELTAGETSALMAFLEAHPDLKKELAAYEDTKLIPDTLIYPATQTLLKPEPQKRPLIYWTRYGIAAGIAAIIIVAFFKFSGTKSVTDDVATSTAATPILNLPASQPAIVKAATKDTSTVKPGIAPDVRDKPGYKITHVSPAVTKVNKREYHDKCTPHPVTMYTVEALPTADVQPLAYSRRAANMNQYAVPEYLPEVTDDDAPKYFWNNLPIDDTKKAGLNGLARSVSSGMKHLNDKSLSIRIEKKKLIISF